MGRQGARGVVWTFLILAGLWAGTSVEAAGLPGMHVAGMRASYEHLASGGFAVRAVVSIRDMEHLPVRGATVSVAWTVPPGAGGPQQQTETDVQGLARFQVLAVERGLYQLCVADVVKRGMVYDASLNELSCASIMVW